jgi:hypothetical protein
MIYQKQWSILLLKSVVNTNLIFLKMYFETGSHCVNQAHLKLTEICLPQPPEIKGMPSSMIMYCSWAVSYMSIVCLYHFYPSLSIPISSNAPSPPHSPLKFHDHTNTWLHIYMITHIWSNTMWSHTIWSHTHTDTLLCPINIANKNIYNINIANI